MTEALLQTATPVEAAPKKRGRPAKHADLAARQKAWRENNVIKKVVLDGKIAPTIERLAEQFDCTQTEVMNHLLRFALTNRDWVKQGMTGWNKVDRRFTDNKRPVATLKADEEGMYI